MKDSLLIDSGLLVNFWAKAMDTSNYLRHQLSIRWNGPVFISEQTWTGTKQNLEYMQIFESRVSTFILIEKRAKSGIQKNLEKYLHWLYNNLQALNSLSTLHISSSNYK